MAEPVANDVETATEEFPACAVSVLVCTRNRPIDLARVVASLLVEAPEGQEVVVVDQSDGRESERAIEGLGASTGVRYVRSATTGKGAAMNEGLRLARAPYVVCTDDDCEARPGWVSGMRALLIDNPRVAVAFCRVEAPPHDSNLGYVPTYLPDRQRLFRTATSTRGRRGLGAGMALRRDPVLQVGGIDETFGPGSRFGSGDDWDLELRMILLGWHAFETDALGITHHGFRTFAEGRTHAQRDWAALGAVAAKPVRARRPWLIVLALHVVVVDGLVPIVKDVIALRPPQGVRRLLAFSRGFARGLGTPVDRATLRYRTGTA